MNKRIAEAFAHGKAFIPFITCGDPSLEITEQLVYACGEAANGVYLSENFPGFGASLAQVIESGFVTGQSAAEYAQQEHVAEVFVVEEEQQTRGWRS